MLFSQLFENPVQKDTPASAISRYLFFVSHRLRVKDSAHPKYTLEQLGNKLRETPPQNISEFIKFVLNYVNTNYEAVGDKDRADLDEFNHHLNNYI